MATPFMHGLPFWVLPMRTTIVIFAVSAAIAGPGAAQTPSQSLCIFSGRERSALAWQSAARPSSGGLFGRVLGVANLQPIRSAGIRLEPGGQLVLSDSLGLFQFTNIPNGQYLLRVMAIGYPVLADSITLGADGLVVVAILARPPGDIGISCPDTSLRRPPNVR